MGSNYTWLINRKTDISLFVAFLILSITVCQLPISLLDGRIFFISFSLLAVLFGYTHILSSYAKVYGTSSFKSNKLLLVSPFIIFIVATIIHFLSVNVFWLIFACLSVHHTLTQQAGLIKITSNKKIELPSFLFSITTFGLPLLGTLYLLSDPRGYKPALGWIPTIPSHMNTLILILIFLILLIIAFCEHYFYRKSKVVTVGKYLQYLIAIFCWVIVPFVSNTLEATYACLTIAHGIYYISLIYWSTNGEFSVSKISKKWSVAWFFICLFFASLFIFNLLHGKWLSINTYAVFFAEIILATISWSHYNFDAWIWKKRVRNI